MPDRLLTPHSEYENLGESKKSRQTAYGSMFESNISMQDIRNIREMTNKGWVLGSELFKKEIQTKISRAIEVKPKGGDRKSKQFLEKQRINRV